MGAGGFLLTNYQADMFDFFVQGEDFDYFDGKEDLLTKTEYYLSHEKERKAMAENAHEKVKREHTYLNRLDFMMEAAGI